MIFNRRDIPLLDPEYYSEIMVSDDNSYWLACYKEKFGLEYIRFGHYGNYLQFLFDLPLRRNKDNNLEILKKLLYIAEHNDKPLHVILPDVSASKSPLPFIRAMDMAAFLINKKLEKKPKAARQLNGKKEPKEVIQVSEEPMEEEEELSSQNGHITHEIQNPVVARTLEWVQTDEEEETKETRPRKEMSMEEFNALVSGLAIPNPIRHEYEVFDYDIKITVRWEKAAGRPGAGRLARPSYEIVWGKYFRMYPTSYEFVHVGTGPGGRPVLLFDNEYLFDNSSDKATMLNSKKKDRMDWSFKDPEFGDRLVQVVGERVSSLKTALMILKMTIEPIPIKEQTELVKKTSFFINYKREDGGYYLNREGKPPIEGIEEGEDDDTENND